MDSISSQTPRAARASACTRCTLANASRRSLGTLYPFSPDERLHEDQTRAADRVRSAAFLHLSRAIRSRISCREEVDRYPARRRTDDERYLFVRRELNLVRIHAGLQDAVDVDRDRAGIAGKPVRAERLAPDIEVLFEVVRVAVRGLDVDDARRVVRVEPIRAGRVVDEVALARVLHPGAPGQRDLFAVDEHRKMDVMMVLVVEERAAIDLVDLLALAAGRCIPLREHRRADHLTE